MADEFFTIHDHCMPGIVAALKPNNDIGVFGKQINYFAFAFIPPLGSDDYYIGH